MSISTKTGDRGKTSLCSRKRLAKDDLRIEVCGILDELNAYLGFSKSLARKADFKKIITAIQKDLFLIGGEIATQVSSTKALKKRVNAAAIKRLEGQIAQIEQKSPKLKPCFRVPGKNIKSAGLDVARTLTRRLERRMVKLKRKKYISNDYFLVYLNRLSDLLFLLSYCSKEKSVGK